MDSNTNDNVVDRPSRQVGHPEYAQQSPEKKDGVMTAIINQQQDDIRAALGENVNVISDVVNNNLVAARYAAVSGVLLLTAFGLSNTPLFFRFRTVSEIPASYFSRRRRLYGRVIAVEAAENKSNQSIELLVRNLSPVGQILPKKWFDFFMKFSPLAAQVAKTRQKHTPEETKSELLRVRIAGIQSPPVSRQSYKPEQFLERLAKDRTLVSCQLLARQVSLPPAAASEPSKRRMSEVLTDVSEIEEEETSTDQVAVCRLYYRPNFFQLFPNDIGQSLISAGNASVLPSMFDRSAGNDSNTQMTTSKTIDSSQRIQDLRSDVKYLDSLAKTEFEAARKSIGMWSVPEVREVKREVIEEIDFQNKANVFQKVWRWFRG